MNMHIKELLIECTKIRKLFFLPIDLYVKRLESKDQRWQVQGRRLLAGGFGRAEPSQKFLSFKEIC